MSAVHELLEARELLDEAEQAQVREQMERLLETHHFRNSRRYPALLRFIVEETLAGRGEHLKERLLGIHVFDRAPDYDTATDPIVRVTIAEIRKRIAQYYHDEEHDAEIRIELLPGRYTPEFRRRREPAAARLLVGAREPAGTPEHIEPNTIPATHAAASVAVLSPPPGALEPAVLSVPHRPRLLAGTGSRRARWSIGFACLLVAAAATRLLWPHATAVESMWRPVIVSSKSVLFCLPTDVGKKADEKGASLSSPVQGGAPGNRPGVKTFLDYEAMGENVVYSDMMATLAIVDVLAVHHRDYHVRLNTTTTLDDMRVGPTVLIGGLDNPWTMRALAPLRFHFAGSDEEGYWIADTQSAGDHTRYLDLRQQYQNITRDYAIVARLHNQQTGQPEMVIAGIGMSGTAAAGAFVADENALVDLGKRLGPAFKDKDFEVVLSTDVVNGISGSAKVLAVTSW